MIRYAEAVRGARAALAAAGIENSGFEARLLVGHAGGLGEQALPDSDGMIDPVLLDGLVARRVAREPMAFILGRQGFWTLELAVSAATLIPRADSETLIEAAQGEFPNIRRVRTVLDLGTGTGCLLLAALSVFPEAWGVGVDRVAAAVALAAGNALRAGMAGRAGFCGGDWGAAIEGRFDLVLCNPPYIESAAIGGLAPEVAAHEPRSALDGGADGLDAYRRVVPDLARLLAPGGLAVLEVGHGQAPDVDALARAAGFGGRRWREDLGGVRRALVLEGF